MNPDTGESEEMTIKVSNQRSDICDWVEDRFLRLIQEDRTDDAISFADEFFEWMDPRTYINESTHFYLEDELREVYRRAAEDA